MDIYKVCKEKDVEIKKMTRLIKENCFDSKLHYDRNNYEKEYEEFTRECDYGSCLLECDVVKESKQLNKSINGKDKCTFHLFFLEKIKKKSIIDIIIEKCKTKDKDIDISKVHKILDIMGLSKLKKILKKLMNT